MDYKLKEDVKRLQDELATVKVIVIQQGKVIKRQSKIISLLLKYLRLKVKE